MVARKDDALCSDFRAVGCSAAAGFCVAEVEDLIVWTN